MAAIFSPEIAMAASKTSDDVTTLPPAMMVSTLMSAIVRLLEGWGYYRGERALVHPPILVRKERGTGDHKGRPYG